MKKSTLSKNIATLLALFGISAPQFAAAEPKVGDQFGDWVYECAALAANKTVCSLSQMIMSKNQNKRIVKFNLGRNEKTKSLDFVALLPLGIALPSGASITIDTGKTYPLSLKTCLQQGCVATYAVDSGLMKALQSGQKLEISFTPGGAEKPVTINGSLKGLADGMKAANLN